MEQQQQQQRQHPWGRWSETIPGDSTSVPCRVVISVPRTATAAEVERVKRGCTFTGQGWHRSSAHRACPLFR